MATSTQSPGGAIVQSWVSPEFAEQLKAQAELERRSVSGVVRIALEDRLRGEGKPERRRPIQVKSFEC